MSLGHAILGFLHEHPRTGYTLKKEQFDGSVAHIWPAQLPQIYRELERMEEMGWITRELDQQEGKPDRRVCSITEAGLAELREWLLTFQEPPRHREAFLVQLFFAAHLTREEMLRMLREQLQAHQDRLEKLQATQMPQTASSDPPNPQEQLAQTLQKLTCDLCADIERTYIQWLEKCITIVSTAPPPTTGDGVAAPHRSGKTRRP